MNRSKVFLRVVLALALVAASLLLQPAGSEAALSIEDPDPNHCYFGTTQKYSLGACVGCQRCTYRPNGAFWGDDMSCPGCGLTPGGGGNN